MKRIIALALLFVCIFSLASCSYVPELDINNAKKTLRYLEYDVKVVNGDELLSSGIIKYVYGVNAKKDDEIYIIYCENSKIARSVYDYVKKAHDAKIAEVELEIDMIKFSIDHEENLTSYKKSYYTNLLSEKMSLLSDYESYVYGWYTDVVWYGTKDAISDSKW